MSGIGGLLKLDKPVVLASRSPRRQHLLGMAGIEFEVIVSDIEEDLDTIIPPEAYCLHLAWSKAEDVTRKVKRDSYVIGADTIVVLGGEIINKPANPAEAVAMLRKLSGNTHEVYTGIAIIDSSDNSWITNYQRTEVVFRDLREDEIHAYVAGGSPMDKAGAYGIQDDFGAVFVREIRGDYYNIVGLPLELLYTNLRQLLEKNG
jgi:septum formation protein